MITCFLIFVIMSMVAGFVIQGYEGIIFKLEVAGYTLEASIMFVALVVCTFILLIAILVRIFLFVAMFLHKVRCRSVAKQYEALGRGYALLGVGDVSSVVGISDKLQNVEKDYAVLLEGCARFSLGQYESAEGYFHQISKQIRLGPEFAAWLFSSVEKEGSRDYRLRLLNRLCEIFNGNVWTAIFKLEVFRMEERWSEVLIELRSIVKHGINPPYSVTRIEEIANCMLAAECYENGDIRRGLKFVEKITGLQPTLWKARLHMKCNNMKKAVSLLEAYYVQDPHPDIAALYLEIAHDKNAAMDRLSRLRLDCYVSAHLIAKRHICLGQYNAAEKHLSVVLAKYRYTSLYCMMLDVMVRVQNLDEIRNWVEKMEEYSLPDMRWECTKCSSILPEWRHECGTCRTFDSVKWVDR